MSVDKYSFSQLRRLKVQNGIGIDNSGAGSSYIRETKIRRLISKEYQNNPEYSLLFCDMRKNRIGLPYHICINKLEKCEDWQLEAILETAQERSVEDAIRWMFNSKKADRFKFLKAKEREERKAEKLFEEEAARFENVKFNNR